MIIVDKEITLHVKNVNHNSAILVSDTPIVTNASQLFDLVSPKGIFQNE